MKDKFNISFYDKNDVEIGRKTYTCSYGKMISNAEKRAKRIGAIYFWHLHYLRRFSVIIDD